MALTPAVANQLAAVLDIRGGFATRNYVLLRERMTHLPPLLQRLMTVVADVWLRNCAFEVMKTRCVSCPPSLSLR